MHALDFCMKSYNCFNFCIFVFVFYKSKTCVIYYLSGFLKNVIYVGLNYVILVFPNLGELFGVYSDVSDQILGLLK